MVCKKCGHEIAPDSKFCGVCGAVNEDAVPENISQEYSEPAGRPIGTPDQGPYAQPYVPPIPMSEQSQYAQNVVADPEERALAKSCLVFGILGIAFGCSFYLSILGIIFGAIAKSKTKQYMASYPLVGKAKVGRILGNIGFIFGIILTVFFVIWLIVIIAAASSGKIYYY